MTYPPSYPDAYPADAAAGTLILDDATYGKLNAGTLGGATRHVS